MLCLLKEKHRLSFLPESAFLLPDTSQRTGLWVEMPHSLRSFSKAQPCLSISQDVFVHESQMYFAPWCQVRFMHRRLSRTPDFLLSGVWNLYFVYIYYANINSFSYFIPPTSIFLPTRWFHKLLVSHQSYSAQWPLLSTSGESLRILKGRHHGFWKSKRVQSLELPCWKRESPSRFLSSGFARGHVIFIWFSDSQFSSLGFSLKCRFSWL